MKIKLIKATPENFNEVAYILANPDVGYAIMEGRQMSAWRHFIMYGQNEGRLQVESRVSQRELDARSLAIDVPHSTIASHANCFNLLKSFITEGHKVLEVGSRSVSTDSTALREYCKEVGAEYIGFDYYPGKNVDITGDAHKLSNYFNYKFDFIYSSAVFEHLAMPWLVSPEIVKCLNVGGHIYIETHFSYTSHERPWHFFQFSDMALRALFSPALGINCIEAGFSNPIIARFSSLADDYLKFANVHKLYCHSNFFGEKVIDIEDFSWENASMEEITNSTHYPLNK